MKKPFSSKINEIHLDAIKQLAIDTRIPMARLLEEALEDLMKKYNREIEKK